MAVAGQYSFSVLVILVLAGLAILGGVVLAALGRAGEMATFPADHAPLDLGGVSAADVALLRPPMGLWGYQAQATEEALQVIARSVTARDATIAALRRQLDDLRGVRAQQLAGGAAGERTWPPADAGDSGQGWPLDDAGGTAAGWPLDDAAGSAQGWPAEDALASGQEWPLEDAEVGTGPAWPAAEPPGHQHGWPVPGEPPPEDQARPVPEAPTDAEAWPADGDAEDTQIWPVCSEYEADPEVWPAPGQARDWPAPPRADG